MNQMTFSDMEYSGRKRVTQKEKFLREMNDIIPWADWVNKILPYYPKGKRGRPPRGIEVMLRMYLLQIWFNLSDEGLEDAIYDSYAMRNFVGINFLEEQVPDATTLLKFRHLLEEHHLGEEIFNDIKERLQQAYGKSSESEWAFPLFHREKGKSFSSIPYGWSGGGTSQTNAYFACGLAGAHAGSREGGWLFPLFNHRKYSDFDEKCTWLDRDTLPDEIKVTTRLATNRLWNATTKKRDIIQTYVETNATYVSSWNEWSHFLFSDNDRHVNGSKKYKQDVYTMTASHKMGNRLFFRREQRRSVDFDLNTRKKVSDTENGWHSLLPFGYYHEWKTDAMKGTSKQSHKVLWKLWDWEEENGDVALDMFPGFTYDTKKNGYCKTAFFWRLFRCESDPKKGRKVDLFFIPVWR